ncbi:sensor histidine kinase [Dorea sp. D27]|uniref:sensor histidine kinase n=1 Tax=Dorea sp. D27 TaxID=658665 RepID=UPI0006732DA2|nr:sensor histidine kinase [Dorea sp. D27]KMZ52676.1 putative sensor histidine kinase [Dorea sp. D27]
MLNTIEFILNLSISLAYGALLFFILKKFLPLRRANLVLECLEVVLIAYTTNISIFPGETTGTIGSFLALFILMLIFHRSSLFLKLSATILIFPVITAISYILEDVGYLIWLHICQRRMTETAQNILHTVTMFFRIPIWYAVYYFIKIYVPHAVHDLSRRMWILIDLVSLSSFIGIITVIYKSTYATSYAAYPACIASLITNMGCFYLCTYLAKTMRTEMELKTYQYQQVYYKEIEAGQQTIRSLRHDMKNHLNIVRTFLHNKNYEDADQYLNELDREFITSAKVYCKSSTVNAVLSAKEQTIRNNNIQCSFQIDLEETPQIDNIDLCSLLANTLDNAIEACCKIPDYSMRFLTLKARCKNNYFSYELVNSKANAIIEESGHYKTSKNDTSLHGIGLGSVARIVEKYDGDIKIDYTDDTFTVTILIQG